MYTNQSGWKFVPAGDCLEVYLPPKRAERLEYPPDVPYDVIKYDSNIAYNDLKKIVNSLAEYN